MENEDQQQSPKLSTLDRVICLFVAAGLFSIVFAGPIIREHLGYYGYYAFATILMLALAWPLRHWKVWK